MPDHVAEYLEASALGCPERVALVDSGGQRLTYSELNRQADALAGFLASQGIGPGDRVAVALPKSFASVVSLFGIVKAGAAYVPVDPATPVERGRHILTDSAVRAVIGDERILCILPDSRPVTVIVAGGEAPPGTALKTTAFEQILAAGTKPPRPERRASDLAYILYTSGSTGMPKGAMITHGNAVSFIEWCAEAFGIVPDDRVTSNAPFHFDLSVLDLYPTVKCGATLYLINEELGRNAPELARFVGAHRLTIWTSTPSVLMLLVQFGRLHEHDVSSLRLVLFGGEVFPVRHLRELRRLWPDPVFYNLYGPTEITTACTYGEVPRVIPDDREAPYPIGFPCSHCRALVLDEHGREVPAGDEGLLFVSGPSVFAGYWNRPAENQAAFVDREEVRWYNTGDVVRWIPDEGFSYVGRRDRMVKRRGYRIELGEIEGAMYAHPRVREAAVVPVPDEEAGVRIVAVLSCRGPERPSTVDLKTFCATRLPGYMIPDRFLFRDCLPRTSTDKVDYQALAGAIAG